MLPTGVLPPAKPVWKKLPLPAYTSPAYQNPALQWKKMIHRRVAQHDRTIKTLQRSVDNLHMVVLERMNLFDALVGRVAELEQRLVDESILNEWRQSPDPELESIRRERESVMADRKRIQAETRRLKDMLATNAPRPVNIKNNPNFIRENGILRYVGPTEKDGRIRYVSPTARDPVNTLKQMTTYTHPPPVYR